MNWITNYVRPRINSMLGRRPEVPENLWIKCPETGEMVFHKDLEDNKWVIPASGYHMKMPAKARLADLFDGGVYEALPQPKVAQDPLKFRDSKKYTDRLRDSRAKTEQEDTILAGVGLLKGLKIVAVVHEFQFMGGSLGIAAGEAIVKAFERAISERCPLVMFPASGGARMQEGILSLMQLPRTTVAVNMLKEAGMPYIVVLTNPTTGGVTASYAMLGDVHIAEPGAEHGMVDMVIDRREIPETLANLLKIMTKAPADNANAVVPLAVSA